MNYPSWTTDPASGESRREAGGVLRGLGLVPFARRQSLLSWPEVDTRPRAHTRLCARPLARSSC
jgi:hypothetical protein